MVVVSGPHVDLAVVAQTFASTVVCAILLFSLFRLLLRRWDSHKLGERWNLPCFPLKCIPFGCASLPEYRRTVLEFWRTCTHVRIRCHDLNGVAVTYDDVRRLRSAGIYIFL